MQHARNDAPPQVTAQTVMDAAVEATGLSDFGKDQSFRTGLDVLMQDVADMAGAPARQEAAMQRITGLLIARLRIVEDDKRHPEIRAQVIERPMFITGLPRTGTTITFDMLSLDPGARYPREWEWLIPWPATEAATIDTDGRIAMIQPQLERTVADWPELRSVHRFDCRTPGECNGGMMYHFSSANWWAEIGARRHAEWLIDNLPQGHFADHKRLLQQMQWKGPPGRWLLKAPQHLFHLPALFDTYPDARVVWTHRDPVVTFSSLASMVSLLHRVIGVDTDPLEVGDTIVRTWSRAMLNAIADRTSDPRIDRAVIDQPHKAIVRDPLAAMRRNLAFFDQPVTAEFETRLQRFLVEDDKAQRAGKHKHRPEDFGIDREAVRRDLAPYYERFGALIA